MPATNALSGVEENGPGFAVAQSTCGNEVSVLLGQGLGRVCSHRLPFAL